MRNYLLLTIFLVSGSLLSAQNNVSAELKAKMADARDGQLFPVWILLDEQLDYSSWEAKFRKDKTSNAQRTLQVITALKAQAAPSQAPILSEIRRFEAVKGLQSYYVANMIALQAPIELLQVLDKMPGIRQIQSIPEVELSPYERGHSGSRKVNGIEKGLARIQAPFMWQQGYTGYGRKAFIIDTGTDPAHPALQEQYWGNQVPDNQAFYAKTNIPFPYDCDAHGSHVTGTIMGLDPITHDTIGVAFEAKWMASPSLRVCLTNIGIDTTTSSLVDAFQWALDPDGNPNTIDDMPDAINNSWHNPWVPDGCENGYKYVFNSLELAGVAVVFANGNEGPNAGTVTKPAMLNTDLTNTFAVGALDGNTDALPIADFSSHGPSPCPSNDLSLQIKPEVSAPGVNVRSSIPGGGYDVYSGTSMASPHVCGAVILLKQAFPDLPGSILKEALYFSALDLGVAGEDNTFGMGMIQLEKAFNYLQDKGHVPVNVQTAGVDVQTLRLKLDKVTCNTQPTAELTIGNLGNKEETCMIEWTLSLDNNIVYTSTEAEFNFAPGIMNFTFQFPDYPPGAYVLEAKLVVLSSQDDKPLNNIIRAQIQIQPFSPVSIGLFGDPNAAICSTGSIAIEVQPTEEIAYVDWFANAQGGTRILSGNPALFPVTDVQTSYFAEAHYQKPLGLMTNAAGTTDFAADSAGMVFHTHQALTIKSIEVEVAELGIRSITLYRLAGKTQLSSKPVIGLKLGVNKIDLGFAIPDTGTYVLVLTTGKGLKYHTEGNFPYVVQDIISLDYAVQNFQPTQGYRYFYNWNIDYANPCGRTEYVIPATLEPSGESFDWNVSPVVGPYHPGESLSFNASPPGNAEWYWYFGDRTASENGTVVSHTFIKTGTYPVILCRSENSCESCIQKNILIETPLGSKDLVDYALEVYPNPVDDVLYIKGFPGKEHTADWSIINALGQVLHSGKSGIHDQMLQIPVNTLVKGYYFIQLDLTTGQYAAPFVK